jgi:hypothetical protein
MAKGVYVQVKGMKDLRKAFKDKIPQNLVDEIDAELSAVSANVVDRAVQAAPVDTGSLKNQITFSKIGEMQYEIVSGAPYSAYVEFGTITKVSVPPDLQSYAAQFKGKGIKKSGGMRARPFFFPQRLWAQSELNKNLKNIVKHAIKK